MSGRHGVADAALDLHTENECRENGLPRKSSGLRQCEHGRRDRRRRMNDRIRMGIVEIEQIGRNRVDERRGQRIEPFRTADDRGCRGPAERQQRAQRGSDGRVIRRTQRGREEVQDRAFRLMILRGNIRPCRAGDEIGENCAGALRFFLPH